MKVSKAVCLVLALLLCVSALNLGAVFAEDGGEAVLNSSYDVAQMPDGTYLAYNIVSRDVEIFVTDGQLPIVGATVSLGEFTSVTGEDGIAFFPDVPTGDERYNLVVTHDIYGTKSGNLRVADQAVLPSADAELTAQQYTISYYKPGDDDPVEEETSGAGITISAEASPGTFEPMFQEYGCMRFIRATFTRTDTDSDPFVKKSWLRVDTLDENADLKEAYRLNSYKENIIENSFDSGSDKTSLTVLVEAELNGTYIFCGWTEENNEPNIIERVDVADIAVERPMMQLDYELFDNLEQDYIGNIIINQIDCASEAEIKRYVIAQLRAYAPGYLPGSLPPDQRNELFDTNMQAIYNDFTADEVCVQNVENPESVYEAVKYPIYEAGDYIVIAEDTNGHYNYATINVPSDYQYSIRDLTITTPEGEALEAPQIGESFTVEAEVRNFGNSGSDDYVVIAIYSEDGRMMHTDSTLTDFEPSYDIADLTCNVPAQSENIGSIKALVWGSFRTMEVLSEAEEILIQTDTSDFSGGDGTAENPYIINTAAELDAVRNNLSAYYRLESDIDLTAYLSEGGDGYAKWGESGWDPIGSDSEGFVGQFDGNSHKITGLYINRPESVSVGLFKNISSIYMKDEPVIKNFGVVISEAGVKGADNVGGLLGYNSMAVIDGCYVTGGSVTGETFVGGLVGSQDVGSVITGCYSESDVICDTVGSIGYAGGLLGGGGSVENSYAGGDVTSSGRNSGGLVGGMDTSMSSVSNCRAYGTVVSTADNTGGLIGRIEDTSVSYSYAFGDVSGENYVGGLVGMEAGKSTVAQCQSMGDVTAAGDYAGGIAGAQISPPYLDNYNIISSCYAGGNVTSGGTNAGAISGYVDSESSLSDNSRDALVRVNGAVIESNDENSAHDKIHGTAVSGGAVNPSPTFLPNMGSTLTIKCVDQDGQTLYEQKFTGVQSGTETIYAPEIAEHKLIGDTPKAVDIEMGSEVTVEFLYEAGENETPLPVQTETPVLPEATQMPGSADLTVKCVDEGNNVIYMQTIRNMYAGETQKITAPPIDGYSLIGDDTVSKYIFSGHNTVEFLYSANNTVAFHEIRRPTEVMWRTFETKNVFA